MLPDVYLLGVLNKFWVVLIVFGIIGLVKSIPSISQNISGQIKNCKPKSSAQHKALHKNDRVEIQDWSGQIQMPRLPPQYQFTGMFRSTQDLQMSRMYRSHKTFTKPGVHFIKDFKPAF